jgi:hypothetical protein
MDECKMSGEYTVCSIKQTRPSVTVHVKLDVTKRLEAGERASEIVSVLTLPDSVVRKLKSMKKFSRLL